MNPRGQVAPQVIRGNLLRPFSHRLRGRRRRNLRRVPTTEASRKSRLVGFLCRLRGPDFDRVLTGLSKVADIFGFQTGFSARAMISRKFCVCVFVCHFFCFTTSGFGFEFRSTKISDISIIF